MCEECKEYKSFDELPEELKQRFKSGAKSNNLKRVKDGYMNFINQLNQRGDELVGGYIKNSVKTQVKFSKCGHVADISPNSYKSGQGCGVCSGLQVQRGVNDIATTHPQYTKYFVNIEDTYTYTYSSNKKVELKCPNCGHTKAMQISKLTLQGFSCDLCSDGISYPEKLMASILTKLDIEFIKQMSYDSGEHKYDFYLPQYNAILETHGMQHYEQSPRGRSLEEEQKNDEYKRELAIGNGILNKNYHEIDCRYSTLEWCKPNIEKTLTSYVDVSILTDEDWKEVDLQAQKSLKIEVCKYWKENKKIDSALTIQQVVEVFGIGASTVQRYLHWGNTNGFCIYDGQEEKKASDKRNSTFVYLIKPNGGKWFDEPMSMVEMERQTGISRKAISNNIDKGALKYHPHSKYDPKYIGSRVVSADTYDNNKY